MSRSYSGGALFGGLDARQYRSTDSHNIYDMTVQSNNGAIKLEILEAADLPSEVNPFCYAWLFVNTEEYNHFSGTGLFSIDTLESYLSNIENSPQVQTCTLHSTSDPVWRESFTVSDAILCSHEVSNKVLVPLAGRSATVVISVHNTLGVFGMEEMVGRAYIKDLRPGDVVNQWCLLYRSDHQQVLGRTGKPTAIHLRIEYLKHSRTLAWTEASSAESNLMSENPLASSSRIRADQPRMHMSLSSLPSFSKRGPIVVSQPKMQNQTPVIAEPPMDLLMQSSEAATLHQQNLALSRNILHKSSLAPLLPFIYENQEWYVIEGICSGDKVIEIGPRRTNKPVSIRYCKGNSSQIVINLQGVTEMIHIENCSNLRGPWHCRRRVVGQLFTADDGAECDGSAGGGDRPSAGRGVPHPAALPRCAPHRLRVAPACRAKPGPELRRADHGHPDPRSADQECAAGVDAVGRPLEGPGLHG
jgi:hypothetical protein